MKKVFSVLIVVALCTLLLNCADNIEQESNYMMINGQRIECKETDESCKGTVMIPIVQLFKCMDFSIKIENDVVYLDRDAKHLLLDLTKSTIVDPEKPWYDYLSPMPGETGEDRKIIRYKDDLLVCKRYVYSMFQLMGGSVDIRIDEKTGIINVDATISR
jgi:hypothetical protein